jgi:putative ABC transport system permease protein
MAVFYQRVVETIAALPGVTSVGAGTSLPIAATRMNGSSFDVQSRPRADDQIKPVTMYHAVMTGYFETLGIRLIEGRLPERADADPSRRVAWVNQTFARSFLDGRAIGERIRIGDDQTWLDIVGVVGDVRTFGLREEIRPMTYLPLGTSVPNVDLGVMQIVVATTGDPASLAPLLRPALDRVDRSMPLTTTRTMSEVVSSSLAQMSLTITLVTLAALIALALGAVGLYGVISYVVSQRTAEIGVRMALGARPSDVRALVLRQGLSVVVAGMAVGLVVAAAASQVLTSLLFEVSARDPVTFAGVAALLLAVSTAAIYPPVQRAVAIDPVRAFREDV